MSININELIKNTKGSLTVETSIIFSIIFLLLAALVYLLVITYQYSFLQSVANEAANTGAYAYVNKYSDLPEKTDAFYPEIANTASIDTADKINTYISKKLDESFLDATSYYDNLTSDRFLSEQLNITITQKYPLPIGNLFKVFGISQTINIKAEAHSPLDKNAEFVRNLDTVLDIKRCISNSDNKWIGKDSNVNYVLEKLLKKD